MPEKSYIVPIVSIVVFVALLGFSTTNFFVTQKSNKQQIQSYLLPLAMENLDSSIQKKLLKPSMISLVLSTTTLVGNNNFAFNVTNYLKSVNNQYPDIDSSYIALDKNQVYFTNFSDKKHFSNDDKNFDRYFELKESNQNYLIKIKKNGQFENSTSIFMDYKIYDKEGKFLGIAGVNLNSSVIENVIKDFEKKYNFNAYFISSNGTIIFGSDEQERFSNLKDNDFLNYIKNILVQKNSAEYFNFKNDNFFLKIKYFPNIDAYLFVEAKISDFNTDNKKAFMANIFISLFVTIFITSLILFAVKYYQKRLKVLATTDILTNIPNRTSFNHYFQYLSAFSQRNQTPLSLAIFDIDNFKLVNDTFGHVTGDDIIQKIATIASECIRKSDMLARWGGDEFVLLFPNTKLEDAYLVCEKIRLAVFNNTELSLQIDGKQISISIGLVETNSKSTMEKNIKSADKLLYISKTSGKNITTFKE